MAAFLARQLRAAVWFTALACGAVHAAPAASSGDGVTVYAVGDIARCAYPDPKYAPAAATADTVAAGLAADPQALVLTLGDNTYPVGAMKEFTDCYAPTWGRFKDRTWPSPGNHEYYTRGALPYFQYFGARAAHGWYSLEIGSWHVVSLDSNVTGAAHAAQIEWLRADLASHPARCTLAFWHHPLYSSGGHGNQAVMHDAWNLLYRAGAELVLSGHDHDYERFAPQDADGHVDAAHGLRQFVVGTGGAYPTPFLLTVNHSELRDASRTGVLKLRLRDGRYDWEFLESSRVTTLGVAPPDKGSGVCH
jgi:3',5'-cyclic AMP phosphodiesterase CpdA